MATEIKASVVLKRRFHKAKEVKGNEKLSFKKFVRKMADDGDPVAKAWFVHKSPRFNDEARALRLKNKGARIAAEKNATKLARRKKGQGKGGKATTATAAAPAKDK